MTKKPDCRFALVPGEGHEFVEAPAFLLAAGLQVPRPPTLHKLPCTHASHWFLPFVLVTGILRTDSPSSNSFSEATCYLDKAGFLLYIIFRVKEVKG